MAENRTSRLSLPQWTAGTDSPSRADFNEAFLNLETSSAMFSQGTLASRPTAGKRGRFYVVVGDATAANNNQVFYDTGTGWITVGSVASSSTGNVITAPNPSTVALKVVGATGQTANLQQWVNSTGTVVAYVTDSGTAYFEGLSYGGASDFDTITVQTFGKFVNDLETKNAKVLGDLTATVFKSTAVRSGDSQPKTQINGDGSARLDGLIPPGSVMMWATNSAPSGWLMCQGQTVSQTTYADLYAAIGTTFGPATGGTFTLPDFRTRNVRGAGPTNSLGASEGSGENLRGATHQHAHMHVINNDSAAHTHTINSAAAGSGTTSSAGDHTHNAVTSTDGSHNHAVTVNDAGFHSHVGNGPTATNTQTGGTATRVTSVNNTGSDGSHNHAASTAFNGSHSHTVTATTTGAHTHSFSGTTHDHGAQTGSVNQPHQHGGFTGSIGSADHAYLAINFIIKH